MYLISYIAFKAVKGLNTGRGNVSRRLLARFLMKIGNGKRDKNQHLMNLSL